MVHQIDFDREVYETFYNAISPIQVECLKISVMATLFELSIKKKLELEMEFKTHKIRFLDVLLENLQKQSSRAVLMD